MNQALRVALILAAFVGIFAAGAAVGGVVMVHFTKERFDRLDGERKEEQRHHQQEQRRLFAVSEGLRLQLQRQQQELQQQRQQQQQQAHAGQLGQPARPLTSPEQFGPHLMQVFVNQIQPRASNDQRDKIRPMVNQAAEDLRRLRRDTAHSTELILQQLQDQIAAVLNPQQRDRFTDAIARWRDAVQKYNAEQQQRQAQARLAEQDQVKRAQQRRQQPRPLQGGPAALPTPASPSAQPSPVPPAPAPAATGGAPATSTTPAAKPSAAGG